MEEELDIEEQETEIIEQLEQETISIENETAHSIGRASGPRRSLSYNAINKNRGNQRTGSRIGGSKIPPRHTVNGQGKKSNHSSILNTANKALGVGLGSKTKSTSTGSGFADKAKVVIKIAKISPPVIIILIIVISILFLLTFVSVLLPSINFSISNTSKGSNSAGLEATDIPNYSARTTRATRNNPYYYNQETNLAANGLEGECAWYGLSRAQEILATSGSSKKFSRGGNGGEFCEVAESLPDKFTIVNDYTKPQVGSLIVWSGGQGGYGHVAVIEKIIDSNTVFLSEAAISYGQFGTTATKMLWTSGGQYNATNAKYGSNEIARRENCEGNNSGCQSFKEVSINSLQKYSGLNFLCYVYLLD